MSVKKAQAIANSLEDQFGFFLVQHQNSELELLRNMIDEFLELGVETEELEDPEDVDQEDELNFDDDEESEEDCE